MRVLGALVVPESVLVCLAGWQAWQLIWQLRAMLLVIELLTPVVVMRPVGVAVLQVGAMSGPAASALEVLEGFVVTDRWSVLVLWERKPALVG